MCIRSTAAGTRFLTCASHYNPPSSKKRSSYSPFLSRCPPLATYHPSRQSSTSSYASGSTRVRSGGAEFLLLSAGGPDWSQAPTRPTRPRSSSTWCVLYICILFRALPSLKSLPHCFVASRCARGAVVSPFQHPQSSATTTCRGRPGGQR